MRYTVRNILFLVLYLACFARCRSRSRRCKNNAVLSIEPIVGRFEHSEGPHWDNHNQKLYFVDIDMQKICRFDPETKDLFCIYIANGPVGVAIPVRGESDKLIAGSGTDFILVTWNGHSNYTTSVPETLAIVDQDRKGTRWNDGKVDFSGRFWGGTIGPETYSVVAPNQASLYLIDSDFKPEKKLSPVTNSNGLAWNLRDDTFYYIDTPTLQVAAFDFEPINGTISNKRIAFDLQKNNISGLPDGMTIDTNGNLWVALYNGGGKTFLCNAYFGSYGGVQVAWTTPYTCIINQQVVNVNPDTGKVLRFVELPVKKVTSCTFGGPLLNILFVTTSSHDLTKDELAAKPYAGYVFSIKGLGVYGAPANSFKL